MDASDLANHPTQELLDARFFLRETLNERIADPFGIDAQALAGIVLMIEDTLVARGEETELEAQDMGFRDPISERYVRDVYVFKTVKLTYDERHALDLGNVPF